MNKTLHRLTGFECISLGAEALDLAVIRVGKSSAEAAEMLARCSWSISFRCRSTWVRIRLISV